MKTLLLSAHLDDAVLSAGQFLANQPGCDVLTVFAGVPTYIGASVVTPYDEKCGFRSSIEAMQARRLEDRDAMGRLQCDPVFWDYLDSQYGLEVNKRQLTATIVETAKEYDVILAPLGLVHPDHVALADALLAAAPDIAATIYLWEDLPNRVLHPELVGIRLHQISNSGFDLLLDVPGAAGPMADKIRALLCYRSQLGTGDLDFNLLCVPERFYLLTKEGDNAV